MFYLAFGGVLVFAGFYLIAKGIYAKVKGEHIPATLVGFSDENGTHYPVFKFNYNGQEYTISGGVAASEPDKYKYSVGDTVNIIYVPGNEKYVDVEGSITEFLYALGSIAGGIVFILIYFRQ